MSRRGFPRVSGRRAPDANAWLWGRCAADVASCHPAKGTRRRDMPANVHPASKRAKAGKEALYGGHTRVPDGARGGSMTTAVKHRTFAHPIPSGKEWKRRAQNFPLVHMAGSPTVTRPKHINIGLASKKQQVRKEKNDDESRVPRTKNLAMGARLSAATHHKPPPAQEGHSFFFFSCPLQHVAIPDFSFSLLLWTLRSRRFS